MSGWEETLASYEQTAALYAESQWGTRLTRQMEDFEAQLSGRLVCDLGCGPGRDVEWLIERGHDVVGIDLSPAMRSEARRRVPEARLVLGDARFEVTDQYIEQVDQFVFLTSHATRRPAK